VSVAVSRRFGVGAFPTEIATASKALGLRSGEDNRVPSTVSNAFGSLAGVTGTRTATASKALGPLVRSERDILAHSTRSDSSPLRGTRPDLALSVHQGLQPHLGPPQPTPSLTRVRSVAPRANALTGSLALATFERTRHVDYGDGLRFRNPPSAEQGPIPGGLKGRTLRAGEAGATNRGRRSRPRASRASLRDPYLSERSERGYVPQRPRAR
jgi:hypothetical protein